MGRIQAGTRLPSSRRLSDQLAIGRNTVVRAYEALEIERYVEARPASGIFATLPPRENSPVSRQSPDKMIRLSRPPAGQARLAYDFAIDRPNAGLFPIKAWRRSLQACLSQGGPLGLTQTPDLFGLAALRMAIASHIAAARGVVADPEQVIIVGGGTEALALAARLVAGPGALIGVETLCSRQSGAALRAVGAELQPLPVDRDGLVVDEIPGRSPPALVALTPSHHYPTGRILPETRRQALAAYAKRTGGLLLEDDRGSDIRYEGGLPPAIAALAPDHTLYVNSFAQTLGGGLRLGYLVVPSRLMEAARTAKALTDEGSPWLEQAAVAELMRSGTFAAHLLRMRSEYRQRRDALLDALRRNFGAAEVSGDAGGLHLYWHLPPGVPDAAVIEALGRRARVGVYAPTPDRVLDLSGNRGPLRGLMLGYPSLSVSQIAAGIARLSDAVDDALDRHHIAPGELLAHRSLPVPAHESPRTRKPALRNRQQPALPAGPVMRQSSRPEGKHGPKMESRQLPFVTALYQYPVKGLSPQPLRSVMVETGGPFPFDRVFALARPGTAVTPEAPNWAKKGLFVMLMLDEGLAAVRTCLDRESLLLTAHDGSGEVLRADMTTEAGRTEVEQFFHKLVPTLKASPVLVQSPSGHFMDKPDNVISLINLATIRSLEAQWGVSIDPLRFRANIYIDGVEPWAEFDWVGADLRVGPAMFRVDRRNGRCGATNVNPATGRRDMDIPGSLRRAFGHKDIGVYLIARSSSKLAVGDTVEPLFRAAAQPVADVLPPPTRTAFICGGCYYIYQEERGVPSAGILPGTRFNTLSSAWRCPDCGTDASAFRFYEPTPSGAG
jgi:GntR family transcriptional regulator/MocR family aminotransferase